jgi:hypothetical protein
MPAMKSYGRFALHTDLRQMTPAVVTGIVTIRASSYEMKA